MPVLCLNKWATPFEFHTPPVEDLRNMLCEGGSGEGEGEGRYLWVWKSGWKF